MRRHINRLVALAVLACVSPATAGAATLHVAPGGSGTTCSSSAPCGSFNAAYAAARPGDEVLVAAGTYGAQTINRVTGRAAPNVVIRPADGASVTTGSITVYASYLELRAMKVQDVTVRRVDVASPPPVSNVVLRDLDGRNFNIFDATDVQILGGDWGPASSCGGPHGGGNNSLRRLAGQVPARVVIDGASIHDVQSYDLNACHTEGLAIFAGDDITIRNTRWFGNSVYDIFVQNNSGPVSNLRLENNWFGPPVGTTGQPNGTTVAFSTVPVGVKLLHNSFGAQMSLDDNGTNGTYRDWLVAGNVGPLQWNGCSYAINGIVFDYNAWVAKKCASTDVSIPATSYAGDRDYHLTGGPAVDMIPTAALRVPTDIDGQTRPIGAAGDAGADETGTSSPPPPPPPPPPPAETYAPACEPTCDEQIAALTAERDDWKRKAELWLQKLVDIRAILDR